MNKIIKNEKVIKRIPLIVAIVFFLIGIILENKSFAAATTKVKELWKTATINGKAYNVYCMEPGVAFVPDSTYRIENKYEVTGNLVKKDDEEVTDNFTKNWAFQRAFILSQADTALSDNEMNDIIKCWNSSASDGVKRALKNGLYDVSSINQTAIWLLSYPGKVKWRDGGKYLTYSWTIDDKVGTKYFVIEKKRNESGIYHYSFSKNHSGYNEGAFDGIAGNKAYAKAVAFSKNIDYYAKSVDLKNKAMNYKGCPAVTLTPPSNISPDYTSNSAYVTIGPFTLKHNSNVEVSTTVTEAKDLTEKDITDQVSISKKILKNSGVVVGTEVTIKISKANMATSIKSLKIQYTAKNVVTSATFYVLKRAGGQNIIAGDGTLENVTQNFEITPNLTLIPPVNINLTKASSLGGNLSDAKFEVVAKQGSTTIKTETITTTGGIATFTCQPTSRDDVEITIEEIQAPCSRCRNLSKAK